MSTITLDDAERVLNVGRDRPIRISAGHRILHHEGKCSRPHGHNYAVRVAVTGELTEEGWVVDKGDITRVISEWDHMFLVERGDPLIDAFEASGDEDALIVLEHPPTAEVMSLVLEQRLLDALPETVTTVDVEVRETQELSGGHRSERMPVNTDAASLKESTSGEETGLPINELFYSIQGEGKLAGTPSVFIRTSGCNLRCWFCDSYHTSWEPTHTRIDLETIIDRVTKHDPADHVVVTGGEPLIHDEVVELLDRLSAAGYHTTVETNGTIHRDASIDLASISPKLASSTPTPEKDPTGDGAWADRHAEQRIDMDALSALVDAYPCQLKFVVTGLEDMPEINDLVTRIRAAATTTIHDEDILLMPEGVTCEQLAETRELTADLAMEHGYRYTPRLHVNLWEDAPGT